jgi:hypothetical protein
MKIVSKTRVYEAPGRGQSAYEVTQYTHAIGAEKGLEKIRMRLLDISDDVPGPREVAYSQDNGKTWPEPLAVPQPRAVEGGMLREWPCEYFIDPVNGRQVVISLEGVFPTDSSEHGLKNYYLRYRVSEDGGRTALVNEEVIHPGYTHNNPMPGIWIGYNAFTNAGVPGMLRLPNGKLLLVISKIPLGPDGKFYNPGGGSYWVEVQVLHGTWRDDASIEWHAGPIIAHTPDRSTRGIYEPALALMPDGRVLCVMRACNGGRLDPESKIPIHKWASISSDSGATWSFPEPWRYDDGEAFFSCDSISQFLRMKDGRLYWIGNIEPKNPVYGGRREKLYIVEVDQKSLRLIRDSVFLIAQRGEGDPLTQLSNFNAHEDRVTGEIVLHLPWFVEQEKDKWGADTWVYRMTVG